MIAILSDVHGNEEALRAVLADCEQRGVSRYWFLGDCVGYGPRPNECSALIRARAEVALAGNHDIACVGGMDISPFRREIRTAWTLIMDLLDSETRDWLTGLEPQAHRDAEQSALFHASPRDPVWEYVEDGESIKGALSACDSRFIFVGHSHLPFAIFYDGGDTAYHRRDADGGWIDVSEGRWICNPGSVGQPRDGDPRAAYMIFDPAENRLAHHRVSYDIPLVQKQILELGLPESNANRLAFGL